MDYDLELDKPREECGVFGIFSRHENVALQTYWGLYALQHRGQESAGIAVSDGACMDLQRGMGLVSDVFRKGLPEMPAHIAIGHVRYSTTGSSLLVNTQPLMVSYQGGQISQQPVDAADGSSAQEAKPRDKGFQHVAQVDQQIVHESPGDESVK